MPPRAQIQLRNKVGRRILSTVFLYRTALCRELHTTTYCLQPPEPFHRSQRSSDMANANEQTGLKANIRERLKLSECNCWLNEAFKRDELVQTLFSCRNPIELSVHIDFRHHCLPEGAPHPHPFPACLCSLGTLYLGVEPGSPMYFQLPFLLSLPLWPPPLLSLLQSTAHCVPGTLRSHTGLRCRSVFFSTFIREASCSGCGLTSRPTAGLDTEREGLHNTQS